MQQLPSLEKNARGEYVCSRGPALVFAFVSMLIWSLLAGAVLFLTRDLAAAMNWVVIPNPLIWVPTLVQAPVLGPLQRNLNLNLSTAEEDVLQQRFLHMPRHTWPKADEPMPATAPAARLLYWGLLSMLLCASVCVLGTLILICRRPGPTPVEQGFQQMEQGGVGMGLEESGGQVALILNPVSTTRLAGVAVFFHLLLVTRMTLQGAYSKRLTADFGADYELWVTVLLYLCLWLLLQAVALRILRSGIFGRVGRFGPTAFCEAATKIIVPFTADPFDTVKDAVMAGMALNYGGWAGSSIGWFSLAYIWLLHAYLLWGRESGTELANTYLAVLLLAPEHRPAPGPAPTGTADDEAAKHTKSCPWLLQQLFMLTTPEKQRGLLVEDGPQAILAVLFQAAHGFQVQVAVMNLGIPLLRLAFCFLVHPRIARDPRVQHWLAKNWSSFEADGNDTKAGPFARELGAAFGLLPKEEAAGVAAELAQGPLRDLHKVGYDGIQTSLLLSHAWPALPSQITMVTMPGWLLGPQSAPRLAADLPQLTALRLLRLGTNLLGPEGIAIIAAVLPKLPGLQILTLGGNCMGDEGAVSVAAALPHLQQLQELNLSSNGLGPKGAAVIAAELPRLPALAKLELQANKLGAEGEELVRRAWRERGAGLVL